MSGAEKRRKEQAKREQEFKAFERTWHEMSSNLQQEMLERICMKDQSETQADAVESTNGPTGPGGGYSVSVSGPTGAIQSVTGPVTRTPEVTMGTPKPSAAPQEAKQRSRRLTGEQKQQNRKKREYEARKARRQEKELAATFQTAPALEPVVPIRVKN
jgi:hypothetical protein